MLLIHGLPQTSVLSAGRIFESGTWAVRFSDLENLKVKTAPAASGQAPLTLAIVSLDGTVLAERDITLSVVAPDGRGIMGAPSAAQATQPDASTAALPVPQSAGSMEDANVLMARGADNLIKGKIHIARLFYRRAAEQGLAAGAMALAQTYDPYELARLNALGGVQPDLEQARAWYERARLLGEAQADGKLKRLAAGR